MALASRAIRAVLVDRVDLLRLDVALQKLALLDERQSRVVELRFFGGLSYAEIAGVLKCSERTITSEWAMARAWLHRELERE